MLTLPCEALIILSVGIGLCGILGLIGGLLGSHWNTTTSGGEKR